MRRTASWPVSEPKGVGAHGRGETRRMRSHFGTSNPSNYGSLLVERISTSNTLLVILVIIHLTSKTHRELAGQRAEAEGVSAHGHGAPLLLHRSSQWGRNRGSRESRKGAVQPVKSRKKGDVPA